jgi:hypothetical protein
MSTAATSRPIEAEERDMTALGWVFMLGSAAFVWGLTAFCYYRVLTAPAPPAEEPQHFRSA